MSNALRNGVVWTRTLTFIFALWVLLAGGNAAAAEKNSLAVLDLDNPAALGTVIKGAGGVIEITTRGPATVCLGVVKNPDAENCMLVYEALVKSRGLAGKAYLEMWCLFPGKGEYFSRGMHSAVSGEADWTTIKTTFLLQEGQKPSAVVLSLVVAGAGKVWIKAPKLFREPKP